jgi:ribonuclease R
MLLANECVADFAQRRKLPVLYRIHRPPSPTSLVELSGLLSSIRVELGPAEEVRPRDLQLFLAGVAGCNDEALINKLVLRAMSRAEYSPEDSIHFGLACRPYLHFTSPIRRYSDLWVHRIIKDCLAGNNEATDSAREGLESLGRWTSDRERRAEEAERIYVKTKQMRFMEQFVGEQFPGLVSGVLRGGFFVAVGEFMVDGFCYLRDLDDYFELDEKKHRLVGRRSRRVFQVGTAVEVVIAGVDWLAREMDLTLVEEPPKRAKGKRRKKKR